MFCSYVILKRGHNQSPLLTMRPITKIPRDKLNIAFYIKRQSSPALLVNGSAQHLHWERDPVIIQMASNQLQHLDKNLKECYEYDIEWDLLPNRLKQVCFRNIYHTTFWCVYSMIILLSCPYPPRIPRSVFVLACPFYKRCLYHRGNFTFMNN